MPSTPTTAATTSSLLAAPLKESAALLHARSHRAGFGEADRALAPATWRLCRRDGRYVSAGGQRRTLTRSIQPQVRSYPTREPRRSALQLSSRTRTHRQHPLACCLVLPLPSSPCALLRTPLWHTAAWIYKCLDLSKERERVLFNDTDPETGFLLNVDTKWKTHPKCTEDATERKLWKGHEAIRDLYCLAICHRRDIRSLRDLTAAHLPLLRNIRDVGVDTVCDVYGVQPHELRVFVHYQPQFYHFHVHFTRLHSDLGCQVERAHLLADIIDTLEADGNAYAKKLTLYYQLKANDKLLAKLVDDGAAVPTLTRAGASDAALAVGGAKHSREVTSPKQKQQQARRMSSSPARK